MRTYKNWMLQTESLENQQARGRVTPAQKVFAPLFFTGGTQAVQISAGKADDVYVFIEDDYLYVLATNNCVGYIGLEVFDREGEAVGDVFFREYEAEKLLKLRPIDAAKRLAEYTYS